MSTNYLYLSRSNISLSTLKPLYSKTQPSLKSIWTSSVQGSLSSYCFVRKLMYRFITMWQENGGREGLDLTAQKINLATRRGKRFAMQHASAVAWGAGNMLIIHAPIVVRQVNEGLPFFFQCIIYYSLIFATGLGWGGCMC